MTSDPDETMIPIKDVTAKPTGIVKSCDQRASLGLAANRVKSGSLTMRVAKFEMLLMTPKTNSQANSLPCILAG